MRLLEWMKRDLRTIVVAVVAATVTAGAPALAHGVEHALFAHNADKVDGKHAVGASSSLANAAGKLVTTTGTGRFAAKNMVPPLNMPPGFTARGSLYIFNNANGAGEYSGQAISYPIRMSEALTPHVVDAPTTECPGTWDAPTAQPGHVCIYRSNTQNISGTGGFEWNQRGGLGYFIQSAGAGFYFTVGGWAATAPTPALRPARSVGSVKGSGPSSS